MWQENILAHAYLWRPGKYTNRIFEAKDGKTCMNVLNTIERHNFRSNDLLTKSNRTELQTYKVEERAFGALCIGKSFKTPPVICC